LSYIYIDAERLYAMADTSSLRRQVSHKRNRPLESVFRNATARVLDFLILNQKFDYSASEISKITQIFPRTLQRILLNLVEKQLIMETGKIGNNKMYIINSKSQLSELLRQYVLATINTNIDNARKQPSSNKPLVEYKKALRSDKLTT
jgi:hypothetical protein